MNHTLVTSALVSMLYMSTAVSHALDATLEYSAFSQTATQADFTRPLHYSKESISFFLKNVFNHPHYAQDFLALNFAHVSQIMSLAPKHPHPRRFIRKGLGLFSLKLQDVSYINSYVFCAFIEDLITYASPYMDPAYDKTSLINSFKQTIGAFLTSKFDHLQKAPDEALTELSHQLYDLLEKQDIAVKDLQYVIHYFLAQALQLLVWSPADQEDTWHCMVAIGERLNQCAAHTLITQEMLDDLYWILLHRYAYFLSLAGPELTSSFFDLASAALQDMKDAFWNTEERELYITTKLEFLQRALIQEAAIARLKAAGFAQ